MENGADHYCAGRLTYVLVGGGCAGIMMMVLGAWCVGPVRRR
jgi:hypothetical protein